MIKVAVCNNMVTPYTNRLFNYIAQARQISLVVISCTKLERNRSWEQNYVQKYDHKILSGIEIRVALDRIIHFNLGAWSCLSSIQPDVVAINGIYPTMLIAAAWAFMHRVPLVFLTDGWSLTFPRSLYHRIVRPFILRQCRSIICASEKGKRFFVDAGIDPMRIFVAPIIPAWAPPAEVPEFDRRSYHLLWCGQLNDRKNVVFFIALAIALHSRIPALRVRVIGDGPMREKLTDEFSRAKITFDHATYVPPTGLAPLFLSSRVLILPTKLDPWGLVCNEAMQCGTPCIVSHNAGAADELVEHSRSGFVLDLELSQWIDAAADLIQNKSLWTSMSKAARQSAAKFSLVASARAFTNGLLFSNQVGVQARDI